MRCQTGAPRHHEFPARPLRYALRPVPRVRLLRAALPSGLAPARVRGFRRHHARALHRPVGLYARPFARLVGGRALDRRR